METSLSPRPSSRELYVFLIKCAARLECPDKCLHTAVMLMHQMRDKDIMEKYCNYTLALAAFSVACKLEEDLTKNLRDFTNVGHSIFHEYPEAPATDSTFRHIRRGIASLEFVILRQIEYNVQKTQEKPLQYLYIYLSQLRDWQPTKFDDFDIEQRAMSVLKDSHVEPRLILDYEPQEVALACISIALNSYDLNISGCGKRGRQDWYETFYPEMTKKRLLKIEKRILREIYNKEI